MSIVLIVQSLKNMGRYDLYEDLDEESYKSITKANEVCSMQII